MDIRLKEHRGRNIATGKEVYLGQYRIILDGRCIGYIRDKPGATVQLIERFSPIELEEITRQVQSMLPDAGAASMVPDVPIDALTTEDEYIDDFDT